MTVSLKKLLEPGRIGLVEIPNRLVFPPMQTRAADNGLPTERLNRFLVERAKGGAGLIIMQHSSCWPEAAMSHGIWLWDDSCIPALRRTARAVHEAGAKLFLQLGGRGTRTENGTPSAAPSSIALSYESGRPREFTAEELQRYAVLFGEAAGRVREAGFDGVEIHAAHGKMIGQFLSPYTNRRTDIYGGSTENRTRFPKEILRSIKNHAGEDFPVIMRISAVDYMEGGLTLEESTAQAVLLEAAGADAFHVSAGAQDKIWTVDLSYFFPHAPLVTYAETIKKAVSKPVIAVGKIGDPWTAERILEEGRADFTALGRPLMADPQLLQKALDGRSGDIRRCLYCLNCETWSSRPELADRGIGCTVNASVLREENFLPVKTSRPRRILIAGGGLAAMEAARTLAMRGHFVELHEKKRELGGQWIVASHGAHKADFRTIIPWLEHEMKKYGVEIHTESTVDAAMIREGNFDEIVLATGALPRELRVERLGETPPLVQGMDVLMDKCPSGQRVVVVGGRYIGMEAAIKLAGEGRNVTLVEALDLGHGTISRLKGMYRNLLVEKGVHIFDRTPVLRLVPGAVEAAHCRSLLTLPADIVVTAIGTVPCKSLHEELERSGIRHHEIGDCLTIGDALRAIRSGAELGRQL